MTQRLLKVPVMMVGLLWLSRVLLRLGGGRGRGKVRFEWLENGGPFWTVVFVRVLSAWLAAQGATLRPPREV